MFGLFSSVILLRKVYKKDETIPIYYSMIGPHGNPVETYSFFRLPFCHRPQAQIKRSLLDYITGNELYDVGINIKYMNNETFAHICSKTLNHNEIRSLESAVLNGYWINLIIDDIVVLVSLGSSASGHPLVFSHYHFTIAHNDASILQINASMRTPLKLVDGENLSFSYSLDWIHFDIRHPHSSSMDSSFFKNNIHYYSSINSALLVFLLVLLVVLILNRVLKRDYSRFIHEATLDGFEIDINTERGWKILHGDVFRPPNRVAILSIISGAGMQAVFCLVVFSGVASLSNKLYNIDMLKYFFIIFVLASPVSGFFSVSFGKAFGIMKWLRFAFASSLILPITVLLCFVFSSVLSFVFGTNRVISPFFFIIFGFAIVFIILPLGGFGGWLALKAKILQGNKCDFSLVSRPIPVLKWWLRLPFLSFFVGVLCSTSILIEVYYILTAVWQHNSYYLWGFLFITSSIMISVSASSTVLVVYLKLQELDYRWQGLSFFASSSTGIFIFSYCMYFYFTKTGTNGLYSTLYYILFSSSFSLIVSLICGGIGYFSANVFVHKIYKNLKID